MIRPQQLPPILFTIAKDITNAGGWVYLVGGTPRDMHLDVTPKDFDFEIFTIAPEVWVPILRKYGNVIEKGLSKFPTYGLVVDGVDMEFAPPRRENKTAGANAHTAFEVEFDPDMSLWDAARRRNFTINAIYYHLLNDVFIDPFGGTSDLKNRVLRMVDPRTFIEDPLRGLIGMQLAGRYQLTVEPQTRILIANMWQSYSGLTTHARWGEWEKWALKSTKPSIGLKYLCDVSWMTWYPALYNLLGLEQDSVWHPEGDAFEHTCHAVDAVADYFNTKPPVDNAQALRLVMMFTMLLHDVGKAKTTSHEADGRIRSIGHEKAGVPIAEAFLQFIGAPGWLIARVLPLIQEHMNWKVETKKAVRRLASRVAPSSIRDLCGVVVFDHAGRPPLEVEDALLDRLDALIAKAEESGCDEEVKPLIMGRHLIEQRGWTPGPAMGRKLEELHRSWLAGKFDTVEEGLRTVRDLRQIPADIREVTYRGVPMKVGEEKQNFPDNFIMPTAE